MIFLDGVGIGKRDPEVNPFARFEGHVFREFQDGGEELPRQGLCLPTDPCLGVDGLPQSATGQVTLFTGRNAARFLGHHLQGFPNRDLKGLLEERSLFKCLLARGGMVTFANAFTPRYLQRSRSWVSATTAMCQTAGVPLRTVEDVSAGRALFFDLSNRHLRERGFDVPLRTLDDAAEIIVSLGESHHLCLYEYFLTDRAGHRDTLEEATRLAREVDRFASAVVERLDLGRMSLVICSDHGNLEDKSTRLHTRNPVPTLVWGAIRDHFRPHPTLEDITPAVVECLGI